MVNINIELPDDLHRRLKVAATLKGTTIKAYVNEALRRRVQGGGS